MVDKRQNDKMTMRMPPTADRDWNLLFACWLIATASALGSLFFSEVLKFTPCVLCWYQRILMYPLVVILAVGILRRDSGIRFYVLPLSVLGLAVAAYHNLLYFGVIPEGLTQCTLGVSCTTRYLAVLGFIDIPLMSLTAFAVITIAMLLHRSKGIDHDQ